MIWRDDDISKYTDLATIMAIQDVFDRCGKVHTVTLLMEDLWESRGIWEWLMTTPGLDIALHGWRHDDYSAMRYSKDIEYRLSEALEYWSKYTANSDVDRPLKVFYPPWNKVSKNVELACKNLGLELNVNVNPAEIYSFHWWKFIGGIGLGDLEDVLNAT